jgi:uncharacterized protein YdeI (YjbR/CyaY-like superfamily)
MSPGERLVEPASRAEWRAWLAERAENGCGAWLVLHKGRGRDLTYVEAVEEAVAAGWIESKASKLDVARYKLWMAPRKKGSGWAPSNKERVVRLTLQGLMTSRGLAVVEAAKADGSWEALDAVMALEVPADLRRALDGDPSAAAFFEGLSVSQRQIILGWIAQAKTVETRQRRIAEAVASTAQGLRPNQWRRNRAAGEPGV